MRSYYAHLDTAMGSNKGPIAPKPVFRSSAIFPALQLPGITSRILFMGYWILKRNIKEIAAVVTLRSEEGKILSRSNLVIQDAKTYRVELADLLTQARLPLDASFTGSMEIEFYSTVNLVFPYAAVVVNYYGPQFSSVVHTAQRVYNDFDDMSKNSQTSVPESGFNIYADDHKEPFIGLINGADPVPKSTIEMEFYNADGQLLKYNLDLGTLAPYQTKIIYPARLIKLQEFLKGKPGAGKVRFNVSWIFPRLVVGNVDNKLPALSITHSYYDCTQAKSDSDYWRPSQTEWYPASLMLPVSILNGRFTNVYFYPIYSPSVFTIDVEIYDAKGKLLGRKNDIVRIQSPYDKFECLNMQMICQDLDIPRQRDLAARIIGREAEGSRFPARVKLGVDLGENKNSMPCNICTNLQPFNPPVEGKPKSFKWTPVLADQPNSSVWIMNSAPIVDYKRTAQVEIIFFREKDTKTIQRLIEIPPHGFIVIRPDEDPELQTFFEHTVGWLTATTTNPYTTTYYFVEHPSGVVGGDHGF